MIEYPKLNDAAKAILMLLEDHGYKQKAYWGIGGNIMISNNGRILDIDFYPDKLHYDYDTTVLLYLIGAESYHSFDPHIIDSTEVNLTDPQSINIIKEWIGRLQHGNDRSLTRHSL